MQHPNPHTPEPQPDPEAEGRKEARRRRLHRFFVALARKLAGKPPIEPEPADDKPRGPVIRIPPRSR